MHSQPNQSDDVIATGDWSTGICSCFDNCVPNCLMAFCCPCVTYGQVRKRIGTTESCGTSCCFFVCLSFFGCGSCAVCCLRGDVRKKFEMNGNDCEDLLCGCCCSSCALAQMATHTKSYKPGDCSFGNPPTYNGIMTRA